MFNKDILKQKITAIADKDYVNYQSLLGSYDFSLFNLIIQHIPKDPFAPPATGLYRIRLRRDDQRIINYKTTSKTQTIAFADYISRLFYQACEKLANERRGTGYSGLISINQASQIIIERSNVVVTDDIIEIRCFLGLPANKRIVQSDIAIDMFFNILPEIVNAALLKENIHYQDLQKHIETAEDAEFLRDKLDSLDLIAFVANDSILPRESGVSDKPLCDKKIIPFSAPESLMHKINLPHAGTVKGLGIRKGVTLIVGGGYHGKSTLLQALEMGIYNHIPGDGREFCVSNSKSVKIRAYSGRRVVKTDISTFINHLPFEQDASSFSTENASGSTSQAVNILESLEIGADVLLMDEDTCAINFMTRDSKMQKLVNEDDEPITTYIDKVKQLYIENNVSTVLVLGGVGDYFSVSDCVIQMKNYLPIDVTDKAYKIVKDFPLKRHSESQTKPISIQDRVPIAKSIDPINDNGKFSIYAKEQDRLYFGGNVVDLTDVEQLMELSQTKALGYAIDYAKKYMTNENSLHEVVEKVEEDIEARGLDVISDEMSGYFSRFRYFELAFAINRLRNFDVK